MILILWWRNFQLEYWRTFQLVSTNFEVTNFIVAPDKGLKYTISL
ncbi:Sb-PDE family phosphodiesterase [Phocaeicola vulgatus]